MALLSTYASSVPISRYLLATAVITLVAVLLAEETQRRDLAQEYVR